MAGGVVMQGAPAADELRYWLALWRAAGIGSQRFAKLLRIFPRLAVLFKQSRAELAALGLPERCVIALSAPDWEGVAQDLRWAEESHHHILTWGDPRYPAQLMHAADAPPVLFIAGDPAVLQQRQLAIVGSRNPSPSGLEHAQQFACRLVQAGLAITSGLALGIDAASHQGALQAKGVTIAVLGCGLDRIYPRSHATLARAIVADGGAVVTEFPIGVRPKAEHFPRRNRIVSGLSLGVLVVEATLRSGSLITARLAAEQGREVFAIPGSIHNPLARGCHLLIRQGAKLVETVDDILEELGCLAGAFATTNTTTEVAQGKNSLAEDCRQLLECLGYESASIDQMAQRSGLSAAAVTSLAIQLELNGLIRRTPDGAFMRSATR